MTAAVLRICKSRETCHVNYAQSTPDNTERDHETTLAKRSNLLDRCPVRIPLFFLKSTRCYGVTDVDRVSRRDGKIFLLPSIIMYIAYRVEIERPLLRGSPCPNRDESVKCWRDLTVGRCLTIVAGTRGTRIRTS